MIRIGLFSLDRTLHPILSSALGRDFRVLLETEEAGMRSLLEHEECDVLILDLPNGAGSQQRHLEACRGLISTETLAVVMAGDDLRSTAMEMVRLERTAIAGGRHRFRI